MPISRRARARGFTYVALLLMVAVIAGASAAALSFGATAQRRWAEEELLWVGEQFRAAIAGFYLTPQGLRRYPRELDELLKDPRDPGVRRHLRRVYADPLTGRAEWGLVRAPDGGIMGVHSLSRDAPIKRANFGEALAALEGKRAYADWQFVFVPPGTAGAPAGGAAPASAASASPAGAGAPPPAASPFGAPSPAGMAGATNPTGPGGGAPLERGLREAR